MKIGILTHHYVSNYGAFLQAYALREAVSRAFPDDTVEIIDYVNVKHFIINFGGWFRFYPKRDNMKCWMEKIRVPHTFSEARRKELQCSPRCYTTAQVNKLGYDVIIVGSDEVWNYRDKKSKAPIKFGHGLDCKHIIAYAPSVGGSQGELPDYVRQGMRNFCHISVRDEMTRQMVQSVTGENPVNVLDPTCLADIPAFEIPTISKPYILFYYCDHLPETVKSRIFDYAWKNGLSVYGAGEEDCRFDKVTVNLHPFAWANMFRDAAYVFTGTFHGALFSVINHRQFWVYLTNKSRVMKVRSLLHMFGIENREMDLQFTLDSAARIDYMPVQKRLDDCRKQSFAFLRGAIEQAREKQK